MNLLLCSYRKHNARRFLSGRFFRLVHFEEFHVKDKG